MVYNCSVLYENVGIEHCCGLSLFPQNFFIEGLTPNVTIFGDEAFKEVIKVT